MGPVIFFLVGCGTLSNVLPGAPPLPPLPEAWASPLRPAGPVLKEGPRTCRSNDTTFRFKPNLSFEVANPKAKFAGTWREVDDNLVYLTKGPIGPDTHCTAARFVAVGDLDVLLCAEGPFGCDSQMLWAIEVIDDGAGPAATELVARILSPLQDEGPGVVFSGRDTPATHGGTIQVRYRPPASGYRKPKQTAEAAARLIDVELETEAVEVIEDPTLTSPVVVRVDGSVSAPRHAADPAR